MNQVSFLYTEYRGLKPRFLDRQYHVFLGKPLHV
jgi:hypothetical protein